MGAKLLFLALGISSLVSCYEPSRHSRCLPRDIRDKTKLMPVDYKYLGDDKVENPNRTLVSLSEALGWTEQEPWMSLLVEAAELFNTKDPNIANAFRNLSEPLVEKWLVGRLSQSLHRNERCIRPLVPAKYESDNYFNRQTFDFFRMPLTTPWAFSQWDTPDDIFADCYRPRGFQDHDMYWSIYWMRPLTPEKVQKRISASTGPQRDFWTSLSRVMRGLWKCGEYECGSFGPGSAWVPERNIFDNTFADLSSNLIEALAIRAPICFVSNWKKTARFKGLYYIDISTPMSEHENAAKVDAAKAKEKAASDAQKKQIEEDYTAAVQAWLAELNAASKTNKTISAPSNTTQSNKINPADVSKTNRTTSATNQTTTASD